MEWLDYQQEEKLIFQERFVDIWIGWVSRVKFLILEIIGDKYVGQIAIQISLILVIKMYNNDNNMKASKSRDECALLALNDMINYLRNEGDVSLYDGTNTTK